MSFHPNTTTRVFLWAATGGMRLFWNRLGFAWQGRAGASHMASTRQGPTLVQEVVDAKKITLGLEPGAHDLVGWESVRITQAMVGTTIARFVSAEVKTQSYAQMSPEQRDWTRQVLRDGGRVLLVRDDKAANAFDITEVTAATIQDETANTRSVDRGRSTTKRWTEASKADAGHTPKPGANE